MAIHLSAGAIERIAEARRQAIAELKRACSVVRESDKVGPFLHAFMTFAAKLFDAEADELLRHCKTKSDFGSERNKLAQRIIEDILPDRGLASAWANMPEELKRVSTEWDLATGCWAEIQRTNPMSFDGEGDRSPSEVIPVWEHVLTQTPARPEVCTFDNLYGYWEQFAPSCVPFALRFPKNNAKVREALFWAIQRTDGFWTGQFESRVQAGLRRVQDERCDSEMAHPPETQTKSRKRGPKPDFDAAERVAEITARVAPNGDWHSKLEDICEALDETKVPIPRPWLRRQGCQCWADYLERDIAIKAIEYRLKIAKSRAKQRSETLS